MIVAVVGAVDGDDKNSSGGGSHGSSRNSGYIRSGRGIQLVVFVGAATWWVIVAVVMARTSVVVVGVTVAAEVVSDWSHRSAFE